MSSRYLACDATGDAVGARRRRASATLLALLATLAMNALDARVEVFGRQLLRELLAPNHLMANT
jgi:hypothetical protein